MPKYLKESTITLSRRVNKLSFAVQQSRHRYFDENCAITNLEDIDSKKFKIYGIVCSEKILKKAGL